jgi:hypothetical protein
MNQKGTAAIEFGLFIPLLVIFVVGIIEIGLATHGAMQVQNAVEAGIVYAAKHGWDASGITDAILNASGTGGISASPAPSLFCGCPGSSGVSEISCAQKCASGTAPGEYIRVSAAVTRTSILPDSGLPLPATLTAEAIVRQN